ncbi:MAG TPA: TraB/GumN family protein [Sphingomicrobium sp.]|nr:TraB/GumN family protein [Sphingomicrobium sp.]
MRIWDKIKSGLAALGLAVAAAGASTAADAKAAKPAMWQVYDSDTSIYLFGTVHLLPPGTQWRTAKFDQAAKEAGTLVVETIIDETNPRVFAAELARISIRPGLPPIVSRVPPEKQAALRAVIAKSGIPEAALNNMETWAAAFALLQLQFKELGVSGSDGVELALRKTFNQAGKPVEQLETNAQQLGFFDTLPEAAQRDLLEGAIETPAAAKQQFNSMLAAWMSGDVNAIARTFNAELAKSPDLREALLRRRNANWSYWLASRMQRPGTVLVAVGAGHLAGDDSVVEMLKKRGYRVKRVQ